jgi:uncharacterized protein
MALSVVAASHNTAPSLYLCQNYLLKACIKRNVMDLWDIPAIDQHAHNLLKPDAWASLPYAAIFTESRDPAMIRHHARHTLFFRRSLRDIADVLACEPNEEAVSASRREMGLDALAARCLQASNLTAVYLDDGFLPDAILPWQWHRQFVPVRRILRLEHIAETLLVNEESFDAFVEKFRRLIDPPPPEIVALKSIAAYRSGLAIVPPSLEKARACFHDWKNRSAYNGRRLSAKPLIDFLLAEKCPVRFRSNTINVQKITVCFTPGLVGATLKESTFRH